MKRSILFSAICCVALQTAEPLVAAPSSVGRYGGISADGRTFLRFESTRRGFLRDIEVAGLSAICTSTIPGSGQLPSEERSTNIADYETPIIRLRSNGRFSDVFDLIDPRRVDFLDARVRVSGRLRGNRGNVLIVLTMNKTYGDGSSQVCGGSARVPVRLAGRR